MNDLFGVKLSRILGASELAACPLPPAWLSPPVSDGLRDPPGALEQPGLQWVLKPRSCFCLRKNSETRNLGKKSQRGWMTMMPMAGGMELWHTGAAGARIPPWGEDTTLHEAEVAVQGGTWMEGTPKPPTHH